MPPRNLSAMTPEEREAKVATLKPQWAQDYIRELEALTRTLHAQLRLLQDGDGPVRISAEARHAAANEDGAAAQDTAGLEAARQEFPGLHEHPEGTHAHPYTRPDHDHIIADSRIAEAPEDAFDPSDPDGPPRRDKSGAVLPAWAVADTGLTPPDGEYATARVLDGRAAMAPLADLPEGAEVRFTDFYQVHYGDHEVTAGARVLIVETDAPLVVRPVSQTTVIIARG